VSPPIVRRLGEPRLDCFGRPFPFVVFSRSSASLVIFGNENAPADRRLRGRCECRVSHTRV